jgi:hypothetical protein
MNHCEPRRTPAAARNAFNCFAAGLLLAPLGVQALPFTRPLGRGLAQPLEESATPYLRTLSAPELRFQSAPPLPAASVRPTLDSAAAKNADAPENSPVAGNAPTVESPAADSPASTSAAAPATSAPQKTPPPVLRDTVTPVVRPEDFLPYFQVPGSARNAEDVTLLVPITPSAPSAAPIPASSATYTQSPR